MKKSEDISIPKLQDTQVELGIGRVPEKDRNYHLGGRSFYFFDFDDNVAFLATPLVLFHKESGREIKISSGDFAREHSRIGKSGVFADYQIDWNDQTGTFRAFRDHSNEELMRLGLKKQIFVHDVAEALGFPDYQWKGPSWSCFYHATFNQRPVSVITARGHSPSTLAEGIELFVRSGSLPASPNFLSLFPVSHKPTRAELGDHDFTLSVAELKQRAIRASVEKAIQVYGFNSHHRFGMSDDDPKNIQLITEEMQRLKVQYPTMSFFVIETQNGDFVKHEVALSRTRSEFVDETQVFQQVDLFKE